MAFAKILAQVVFPTPLGPQNKNDCANLPLDSAFFSVSETCSCPTTSVKRKGLYFRAETIKFSITANVRILAANKNQKYFNFWMIECPAELYGALIF
jgi:hypothetical protein